MMTRLFHTLRTAAIALSLVATAAQAQDMKASVTVDPSTSLATYDFHFDGPPRGFAVLFATQSLLPKPLALPGIGSWELDIPALQVATVAFDASGKKSLRLTVPVGRAPQLSFQPLFIDTHFNLRLTPSYSFLVTNSVGGNNMMAAVDTCTMSWSSRSKVVKFCVGDCKIGDLIVVKVNGRVVCQFAARKDGKRSNWFKHNNPMAKGTRIEITKNGKLWFKNPKVTRR